VPTAKPRELKGRALDSAMAALTREEFYPREAIERGWEGRVVLLLTLDDESRVRGIEVASSSGHPILDGAALIAATRITALPGGRRQVLLPVEFRLE
jgi:protein TonB